MAYKVIYQPNAKEDILATLEFYDKRKSGLSDASLDALYEAEDKLAISPQLFGFIDEEPLLRFTKLNKFQFILIFEIVGETVYVYSVRHTSRDSFI